MRPKLAASVRAWLAGAGNGPPTLFERAALRVKMCGNRFSAPACLLRLSLSPTEEDWKPGAPASNNLTRICKYCLQKRSQSETLTGLRVTEDRKTMVLIGTSDLGLLDGVSGFPSSEGGKVLPEKGN